MKTLHSKMAFHLASNNPVLSYKNKNRVCAVFRYSIRGCVLVVGCIITPRLWGKMGAHCALFGGFWRGVCPMFGPCGHYRWCVWVAVAGGLNCSACGILLPRNLWVIHVSSSKFPKRRGTTQRFLLESSTCPSVEGHAVALDIMRGSGSGPLGPLWMAFGLVYGGVSIRRPALCVSVPMSGNRSG